MDKTPKRPMFSIHSKMFLAGVSLGWILAAIGEGELFSKGTIVAACFGGIIGVGVGDVLHVIKRRRGKPPASPTTPDHL